MACCLWMSHKLKEEKKKKRLTQLLKAKQILNTFTILNTMVLNNVTDDVFCRVL